MRKLLIVSAIVGMMAITGEANAQCGVGRGPVRATVRGVGRVLGAVVRAPARLIQRHHARVEERRAARSSCGR